MFSCVFFVKLCRCVISFDSKYVNCWLFDWLLILMVFGVMLLIVKFKSGGLIGLEFFLCGFVILCMFFFLWCVGGGVCVFVC